MQVPVRHSKQNDKRWRSWWGSSWRTLAYGSILHTNDTWFCLQDDCLVFPNEDIGKHCGAIHVATEWGGWLGSSLFPWQKNVFCCCFFFFFFFGCFYFFFFFFFFFFFNTENYGNRVTLYVKFLSKSLRRPARYFLPNLHFTTLVFPERVVTGPFCCPVIPANTQHRYNVAATL